jgi:hypothetical protein
MCSSCYTTELFLGFAAGIFALKSATIFVSFFFLIMGKRGKILGRYAKAVVQRLTRIRAQALPRMGP